MFPGAYARGANATPDKPAVVMAASGQVITYRELDDGSMRIARLLRRRGLEPGSSVAILLENHPRFFEVCWAAQRSALRYTAINSHLTADEVEYIIRDCGATMLITSLGLSALAAELAPRLPDIERLMLSGTIDGYQSLDEHAAQEEASPPAEEGEGVDMLYSSGTTGRPKGVARPMTRAPMGTVPEGFQLFLDRYGAGVDSVYLSPAPLYHAAPLRFNLAFQRAGATCVVMERFDAVEALRLIERHRVTHSQWVPTMFVRMLKLPESPRSTFDLSSHRVAVHAAAPCPVEVKKQMIEWWGPILSEYYAGTEGNGSTFITSEEWLLHPGSVGRPSNVVVHILDEQGRELPPGEPGSIYFEGGAAFEYHNDQEKTRDSFRDNGWSTLGDVGYLDDQGYLYLTDRKAYMIIRGGVNIYPQEAENILITHPKVYDVAVFGVPHPELGEAVKAVVQPAIGVVGDADLEQELIAHCRARLARQKCPETVDFETELPRHPTGKLYKRLLRDRYWGDRKSRIV